MTDDIYLTGDKAIGLVQARLENVMHLTGENTRSAELCNGRREAGELHGPGNRWIRSRHALVH